MSEAPKHDGLATYRYKVAMTCGGCSGAVTKALSKARDNGAGIEKFDVDLSSQIVLVRGEISQDELTEKIAKTGKKILEAEDISDQAIDF